MIIAGIRFTIINEIRTRETTKRVAGMIDGTDTTTIGIIFAATIRQTTAALVTSHGMNGEVIADTLGPPTIGWRSECLRLSR